jgi:NADPH-dependent glutamate synthase beta subunit-like oxidoreductase
MQLNDSVKAVLVSNIISKFSRCPVDSDSICSLICHFRSFNENEKVASNFEINSDYRGNFSYSMGMFSNDGSIKNPDSTAEYSFHNTCEALFKGGYFNEINYPPSKHKVGIIGSGPAGLSAAFLLGKWGTKVDVYESKKLLGGLSRNSLPIPNVHEKLIDNEIRSKAPSSVNFITESRILDAKKLKEKYSAVIIAVGVYTDKDILIYKEKEGFLDGDSLTSSSKSKDVLQSIKNKIVAIIGYGNLGISLAIKFKKLGAKDVYLIFPKDFKNVPSWDKQILNDFNAGVKFFMFESDKYLMDSLDIKQNRIAKLNLQRIGNTSYFGFAPDYNDVYELDVDEIFFVNPPAIENEFYKANKEICQSSAGLIKIRNENNMTAIDGVFSAGDAVLGGSSVPRSMLSGKKAAINVYNYLEKI